MIRNLEIVTVIQNNYVEMKKKKHFQHVRFFFNSFFNICSFLSSLPSVDHQFCNKMVNGPDNQRLKKISFHNINVTHGRKATSPPN